MGFKGLFGGTLTTLSRTMDLSAMRQNLITSHLANIDTPNYKAFDIVLEDELAKASTEGMQVRMEQTNEAHLDSGHNGQDSSVTMVPLRNAPFDSRKDGNTVDLDRTMAQMSQNNLLYHAAAQIIGKKFNGLKNVIKGGR